MCEFISGIIFKSKIVLCDRNNSHSDLLEQLDIEDTTETARTLFVRAELMPCEDVSDERYDSSLFSHINRWEFNVDQDILPDWFTEDPEKYETEFRDKVKEWISTHVFINKKMDVNLCSNSIYLIYGDSELTSSNHFSNCSIYMYNTSIFHANCHNCTFILNDKAQLNNVCRNSSIYMYGKSQCSCEDSTVYVDHKAVVTATGKSHVYIHSPQVIINAYNFTIVHAVSKYPTFIGKQKPKINAHQYAVILSNYAKKYFQLSLYDAAIFIDVKKQTEKNMKANVLKQEGKYSWQ